MFQTRGRVGLTAPGSACGGLEPEWREVEESQRSSMRELEDPFCGAPAEGELIPSEDEFLGAFGHRARKDHDPREDDDDAYHDFDDEDEDDDDDDGLDFDDDDE